MKTLIRVIILTSFLSSLLNIVVGALHQNIIVTALGAITLMIGGFTLTVLNNRQSKLLFMSMEDAFKYEDDAYAEKEKWMKIVKATKTLILRSSGITWGEIEKEMERQK